MGFSKDMSIFEVFAQDPQARDVLERHGMACSLCAAAQSKSVEVGAILHHIDPDVVAAELNRLAAAQS